MKTPSFSRTTAAATTTASMPRPRRSTTSDRCTSVSLRCHRTTTSSPIRCSGASGAGSRRRTGCRRDHVLRVPVELQTEVHTQADKTVASRRILARLAQTEQGGIAQGTAPQPLLADPRLPSRRRSEALGPVTVFPRTMHPSSASAPDRSSDELDRISKVDGLRVLRTGTPVPVPAAERLERRRVIADSLRDCFLKYAT